MEGREEQAIQVGEETSHVRHLNIVLERPGEQHLNELETESMQVEEQVEVMEGASIKKANKRTRKQLKTPVIRKKPLKDIQNLLKDKENTGKRKFQLVNEDIVDVDVVEVVGKKGKLEIGQ